MMEILKNIIYQYLGKIEWVVTVLCVTGEVQKHTFKKIKEVDEFVDEINTTTYWSIQKIEKFRRYPIKYNKEIIHTPLYFKLKNVTEMDLIGKQEYSFPVIDNSLTNITRKETR